MITSAIICNVTVLTNDCTLLHAKFLVMHSQSNCLKFTLELVSLLPIISYSASKLLISQSESSGTIATDTVTEYVKTTRTAKKIDLFVLSDGEILRECGWRQSTTANSK